MHIQLRDGGGAAAGMRGSHIAIRMCVCDVSRGWEFCVLFVLTFVAYVGAGERAADLPHDHTAVIFLKRVHMWAYN